MPYIHNKNVKFHFEVSEDNKEYVIVLDSPLLFCAYEICYIVEEGYRSNGMSVPQCLWSIISPQYSPITLFPSICHDWLYDNHLMTREEADQWYYDALIENGYPKWKAKLVYKAVRKYGESHWG